MALKAFFFLVLVSLYAPEHVIIVASCLNFRRLNFLFGAFRNENSENKI